ncbi:MAG: hypothetical protein EPO68_09040 [Planctomycetota bacterium]|nr:MAG: hypothetical protein EPO68_09040 [Planctomycetota bacterium]
MRTRRVGRTDLCISAVGLGTCQLRLLPEARALATLRRGIELGVDWIHTSPDYEGAEELVARAVRESERVVHVASDGSGQMPHFEHLYEQALRRHGRGGRLALWGISCIDDQEFVGHDVWGPRGMVAFLRREKAAGRLEAAFCTTHAPPEYVENLITSGCFDAIMLAWNPLGFHVLSSFAAAEGKRYEDLAATGARLFELARRHEVSLLVMKSLGGGLLGASRAFPPHALLAAERAHIRAEDVLRHILAQPGVTAVVPGAGSPDEAEEDARAGHAPEGIDPARERLLLERVASLRGVLCSRCGECETTCSQGLPISWLFRDAYVWMNPSDTFDAVDRLHYFRLHPETELACATCRERTCECPAGLDIPRELGRVHDAMIELRAAGRLPLAPDARAPGAPASGADAGEPCARVIYAQVPRALGGPSSEPCKLWIENAGRRAWSERARSPDHAWLSVRRAHDEVQRIELRCGVEPGARAHLVFDLAHVPRRRETLRFELQRADGASLELARASVEPLESPSWWQRWLGGAPEVRA